MKKIDTLSSLEGRALLRDFYKEMRFEKQISSFSTSFLCWRICTNEREMFRYSKNEVTILHPLGFFSGTALWMEEIVNRYYYSTINSFVYFGAAILLVLIGLRRFSDNVSDQVVIGGVAFEAMMLMFIFVVMLFTPNELTDIDENDNANSETEKIDELLLEIGEIATDFANASTQMEKINENLENLITNQKDLIIGMNSIARSVSDAVAPNPLMIESMKSTNKILNDFSQTIENLNKSAQQIQIEEVESTVRKELEKILIKKIIHTDEN